MKDLPKKDILVEEVPEFRDYYKDEAMVMVKKEFFMPAKIASDAEIQGHKRLVEEFKGNLWTEYREIHHL